MAKKKSKKSSTASRKRPAKAAKKRASGRGKAARKYRNAARANPPLGTKGRCTPKRAAKHTAKMRVTAKGKRKASRVAGCGTHQAGAVLQSRSAASRRKAARKAARKNPVETIAPQPVRANGKRRGGGGGKKSGGFLGKLLSSEVYQNLF